MDTLLHVGLGNAVLATALAALAAVVGRLGRRPALVHSLWLLVLLKLVTPPLWRAPLPWPAAPAEAVEAPAVEEAGPLVGLADCQRGAEEPVPLMSTGPEGPPAAPEAPPVEQGRSFPWQSAVLALWLAGACFWWAIAAVRLVRFQRLLHDVPAAPPDVRRRAAELASLLGLRQAPSIGYVAGPLSPMLFALAGAPRILLPRDLWERLSEQQRDALLLHELAHLKRGDHWVRRLELIVLGLYWWCPVAWWACRELQAAEEECCDAWVVWALPGSAPAYAAALVETVAFLSRARAFRPLGASSAGHVPLLKRRLSMILSGNTPRGLSRATFVLVLLLGAGLLPLRPGRAETPSDVPPDKPAVTVDRPPVVADRPKVTAADWEPHRLAAFHKRGADLTRCAACHTPVPGKAKKGAADWKKAHDDVVRLLDRVRADHKKARDTELALREAIRKLEALQRADMEKARPAPSSPEQRLEEMEKKLDALLKEMGALRRELQRGRPAPKDGASAEPFYSGQRSFFIPLAVRVNNKRVRDFALFVLDEETKEHRLVGRAPLNGRGFQFKAPQDGTYRFLMVAQMMDGSTAPNVLEGTTANLTVIVDTVPPEVVIKPERTPDGSIILAWDVSDANLDLSTLKIEYRAVPSGGWRRLSVTPASRGLTKWQPSIAAAGEVRVSVKDRAGNSTERKHQFPAAGGHAPNAFRAGS